jgi:hypothetical protein
MLLADSVIGDPYLRMCSVAGVERELLPRAVVWRGVNCRSMEAVLLLVETRMVRRLEVVGPTADGDLFVDQR